jgi:peptidoglycan/LPS O-acetylase OafA/YrhL
MNNRITSVAALGAFIIALAIGLIIFAATDHGVTIILWTTLLIFGIALFALSFIYPKEEGKFGPSEAIYRMVAGVIIAMAGLTGMLHTLTDIDLLILAAMFLIVIAVLIIAVALMNGKRRDIE